MKLLIDPCFDLFEMVFTNTVINWIGRMIVVNVKKKKRIQDLLDCDSR